MKLLNIEYKIKQNVTNALLYYANDCLRGNKTFQPFVKYMTDLENVTGKEYIKPIRNALWGFMSLKNKNVIRLKGSDTIDVSDLFVDNIVNNKNVTVVKTVETSNIFKYSWARCSIFLTAYCRFQMIKIILQCPNLDDIILINTDGFISKTIQPHLVISPNIGDFKLKTQGGCIIHNSNNVVFK